MKSRITFLMLFCMGFGFLKAQTTCIESATIPTHQSGVDMTIFAEDFLQNPDPSVTYSVSPSTVGCADVGAPITVTVTGSDGFSCTSELNVVDGTAPVVVAIDTLNVTLDQNGQFTLTPDMIDSGSYDSCGDLDFLSVSQEHFTCADLGPNQIFLAAQDVHGNNNVAFCTVVVEDKMQPTPYAVASVDIQLENQEGHAFPVGILSVDDVNLGSSDNCGIFQIELSQTVFTCADIGSKTVLFAVLDNAGNSDYAEINVNVLAPTTTQQTALVCNDAVVVYVADNTDVTLTPDDVLEGGPYNCSSEYSLSMTDASGSAIANNTITIAHVGQNVNYQVTENTTGNTCWGSIVVNGQGDNCPLSESQISWPEDFNITTDKTPLELTPEYLMSIGYAEADVFPVVSNVTCEVFAISRIDQVFNINVSEQKYKLLRLYTIIDWSSNLAFQDEQEILINIEEVTASDFICDTLPHTAPVGDCASGHTLEDDVEWPGDIMITDHRIEPADLAWSNEISPADAFPIFQGSNANNYNAEYSDVLGGLTSNLLTVSRTWTVTRSDYPEFSWTYVQTLDIDFEQFSEMVTVNTIHNKPLPEVTLTEGVTTNNDGLAYVSGDATLNPYKEDSNLNGVDMLDMALIYAHILGHNTLTPEQVEAAEVSGNGILTTLDLVLLLKMIDGTGDQESKWVFVEKTEAINNTVSPRAHYRAYKQGDVDGSALLNGNVTGYSADLSFDDVLLNAGEQYNVPLSLGEETQMWAFELRMSFDPELVTINDVSISADATVDWFVNEETGSLTILSRSQDETATIGETDALVNITMEAKENAILHDALGFQDGVRSFLVDENFQRMFFNGEVANSIGTDVQDVADIDFVNVFPNPVADYLQVSVDATQISDYEVRIFDINGRQVFQGDNSNLIDFTNKANGSYLLVLIDGENYYSAKIVK